MPGNTEKNKKIGIKDILKDQRTIKIIISLLILFFLFKFIDFNLLLSSLKNMNSLFLLVILLIPINIILRAWRLRIILNKDENLISIKDSCYLNLAGIALNIFLPASSGDIAKSYYGYKWHGIKEEMLSSSILDKFMALFSVFMIGTFSSFLLKIYILTIFSTILTFLLGVIIFYPQLMPWKRINRILSLLTKIKLDNEKLEYSFTISNKIKLKTFIISVIAWIILYFQFYVLCLSFSINISLIYILAVSPLISLAQLFPFTLSGFGSGEVMIIYLFSLINIAPTSALLVSFIGHIVNAIIPGLIGYILILRNR